MVLKNEINGGIERKDKSYPSLFIAVGALALALIGAKYSAVTNPESREGVYCDAINILDTNKANNSFKVTTAFHSVGNAHFSGVSYRVLGEEGSDFVNDRDISSNLEWEHQTNLEQPTIKAAVIYDKDGKTKYNEECTITIDLN